MHIGIRYSLGPAYWQNVVVLLFLMDWRRPVEFARSRLAPYCRKAESL